MTHYGSARALLSSSAEVIRPSRRVLPCEAAGKYLQDKEGRAWSAELAPYVLEPLNMLGTRRYRGIIFVGPARTSKTFTLVFGGLAYIVTCNPGDTTVVQMSNETARSFSREEFDPIFRHSAELSERLSPRARDNNTFDKFFRSGMVVNFGWPAVSQLSGKTRKFMFLTDYDRPENRDNVDGEGSMFDLALKRIETHMSRGKCLAESSPGEDWTDAAWVPSVPHEGPPALGITSLYNRGTMARWYWPCKECGEFSQAVPGPEQFRLPEFEQLIEMVQATDLSALADEYAQIICAHCGGTHRMPDRPAMNKGGVWLHSGETIDAKGAITGMRRNTDIASYWLGGAAAAYQRWDAMLRGYFQALREFSRTGDENGIRVKTNTDFGANYMPRAAARRRKAEDLIQRAEDYPRAVVPEGVHFLTAGVDVQSNRFIVSVMGWGADLESWVIDRFPILLSKREDANGRFLPVDPMVYGEDWDLLIEQVTKKQYPLAEAPELTMSPVLTLVDSGGRAVEGAPSTTQRAYEFWRRARDDGYGRQVMLLKGSSNPTAARVAQTWPDASGRADRQSGATGDVPVWLLNTMIFKDAIFGDLGRVKKGAGFVHLPKWPDASFFAEYVAETRGKKGWENTTRARNESVDLHVYNRAAVFVLGAEQMDWDSPTDWAIRPKRKSPSALKAPASKSNSDGIVWRRGSYLR